MMKIFAVLVVVLLGVVVAPLAIAVLVLASLVTGLFLLFSVTRILYFLYIYIVCWNFWKLVDGPITPRQRYELGEQILKVKNDLRITLTSFGVTLGVMIILSGIDYFTMLLTSHPIHNMVHEPKIFVNLMGLLIIWLLVLIYSLWIVITDYIRDCLRLREESRVKADQEFGPHFPRTPQTNS